MSSVLNLFVPNSTVLNQPMFEIFELREDGEIGIAAIAEPFFRLCDNPELADWIIIPLFSSSLTSENGLRFIRETFQLSQKLRKPLGIFSNSDIIVDPKVNPITIFTPGAYASMKNQVELPALLPYDPVEKWKNSTWESIEYSGFIKIGFCGQATRNPLKFLKDLYTIENLRFKKKKRKSPFLYIPRFLPAFERGRLLRSLENSKILQTDFLLRSHYKAGAITKEEKDKVEKEFYSNIDSNLFTLCLRGMGNYSVRFYQTLAMGRIPVLIDTDSKLPFENRIPYEELIVRIPFQDRFNTEAYLLKFLKGKSSEDLAQIQKKCRKVWEENFNTKAMLKNLALEMSSLGQLLKIENSPI